MDSSSGATAGNWTETVEDLVHDGEIDQAIALLESTVSHLESELEKEQQLQNKNGGKSVDQLCIALQDLSKLYASQGFSLKADQTQSRALQLKPRNWDFGVEHQSNAEALVSQNDATTSGYDECSSKLHPQGSDADDDWEAVADRAPEELFSPECLPGVSKLSIEDSKPPQRIKRRGRGTFAYEKEQGLYSDNQSDKPIIDASEDNFEPPAENLEKGKLLYGTRHALVLAGLPLSTRTTELEKLLEKFKDLFVIRWVNDTSALAVFKSPSDALEASSSIQCKFTVRVLNEDDVLLSSITPKDLEPPRQRPQTSARTARRMIAHSMGIKLPSTFGVDELRKQEEARKNRVALRQKMKDDAWGADDDDAK
ncbi:hypothetical protein CASFOL_035161 [Castilleja foliolosa]|uniref:Uncharacterized protein n=1 Tax=Castilleja foliolosa TaxID=1961234 RepID=A0ABD3BSK1_9LAMI